MIRISHFHLTNSIQEGTHSSSRLVMCGLIGGVLLSIEVGYRTGVLLRRRNPENFQTVPPTIEASIFGLMGLLIGFTFYGAGTRFDNRRNLVVSEANAIGTAYLRLDLLPSESQAELRQDFRMYVRSRLEVYQRVPDIKNITEALDRSSALQEKIWKKVVEAAKTVSPAEKALVLASLNQMI